MNVYNGNKVNCKIRAKFVEMTLSYQNDNRQNNSVTYGNSGTTLNYFQTPINSSAKTYNYEHLLHSPLSHHCLSRHSRPPTISLPINMAQWRFCVQTLTFSHYGYFNDGRENTISHIITGRKFIVI